MAEEFGPWIEHDFGGCPASSGQVVECDVQKEDDRYTVVIQLDVNYPVSRWNAVDAASRRLRAKTGEVIGIVAYRIRRPRALTRLIELIETMPAQPQEVGV